MRLLLISLFELTISLVLSCFNRYKVVSFFGYIGFDVGFVFQALMVWPVYKMSVIVCLFTILRVVLYIMVNENF